LRNFVFTWLPRVTEVIVTNHTRDVYTSNKKSDGLSGPVEGQAQPLIPVVFQGGSQSVLRRFPVGAKSDLGYALELVQRGQIPPDRKLVREVGAGVYELREEDARAWYRVLYIRREKLIQVLHCFEKRSNAIEQKDIETAKTRLKRVLETEREEKRNAKQALRGK
jgi:phage-related protein